MTLVPTQQERDSSPRIIVRDEKDVRVLILALSLFSVHTHNEELARAAESLSEVLADSPQGIGYAARNAPAVTGTHPMPER